MSEHTTTESPGHPGQEPAGRVSARMRAIVQDRFGAPDVLRLGLRETPQPAEDQVLIRVAASSLNMYDVHMTSGFPLLARTTAGWSKPRYPIPGADVAGEIVAVGSAVSSYQPGDEVFGEIGMGAFAEYAVAKENAITKKPASVGFREAASAPLAALTALHGLRDVGGLTAGQRVVINGASGGVGTFAVQIAKALGAEVAAVCSTAKVELVRSLGADEVIDYRTDDFTQRLRAFDLLFDNVGDRSWSQTSRVLKPGGTNVTITGPKHRIMGPFRRFVVRKLQSAFSDKRFVWLAAQVDPEDLRRLGEMLESGEVSPVIEETYPLERVPEALAYLAEGHARGKIVVAIQ